MYLYLEPAATASCQDLLVQTRGPAAVLTAALRRAEHSRALRAPLVLSSVEAVRGVTALWSVIIENYE